MQNISDTAAEGMETKMYDVKKVLSLFSGCGGMDLGLEGGFTCLSKSVNENINSNWIENNLGDRVLLAKTSFKTVFANDIRPDAKSAWVNFFENRNSVANKIYHLESIVDLVKRHKAGEKIFPQADVVTGGFPCCDFSVSGLREGFKSHKDHMGRTITENIPTIETRGSLYIWMCEVISITQPKLFIAENVKGLTNLGDVKKIIEQDFSAIGGDGYLVVPAKILYAPSYGVPQSRERVIFFGFKKSALNKKALSELSKDIITANYDPYPSITHGEGLKPVVTCSDAFKNLCEPEHSADSSQQKYSKAKFMGKHCQGQIEVKLNSVSPTIRAEHHGNIEFRRLSLEHGGKHIEELQAGLPERRLTIRECARIQTFPDEYQFILKKTKDNVSVSSSDAYKIIGNAVPPVLAYNIAKNLEKKWDLWFKR